MKTNQEIYEEKLALHCKKATGKEFDPMTKHHLKYCIDAMVESLEAKDAEYLKEMRELAESVPDEFVVEESESGRIVGVNKRIRRWKEEKLNQLRDSRQS